MPLDPASPTVVGRRMRARREALGWSQEQVGVLIGLDESSSRARISRYELGVHEPPVATAHLIADALKVPLPFLYCEDDDVAALLLALFEASRSVRREKAKAFLRMLRA
jgi:transcriptional regulator with XRE-family HTH domain